MVRVGVLEVAHYQAGPANGGPSSPGPVSGAPNLPAGFTDTFTSRYVDTGGLRQHAVTGGEGPPLLLVHGWPENWYAWHRMAGLRRRLRPSPRVRLLLGSG
jgi:hypothetical protein